MENKTTKNLIILGAIVFSFAFANNALAYSCYGYSCNGTYSPYYNYQDSNPGYLQNGYQPYVNPPVIVEEVQTTPNVVNNYYYTTNNTPASTASKTTTVAKTNTTSTAKTNTNTSANNTYDTNGVNYNNSGHTAITNIKPNDAFLTKKFLKIYNINY